jgi:hypothetical protein
MVVEEVEARDAYRRNSKTGEISVSGRITFSGQSVLLSIDLDAKL